MLALNLGQCFSDNTPFDSKELPNCVFPTKQSASEKAFCGEERQAGLCKWVICTVCLENEHKPAQAFPPKPTWRIFCPLRMRV